MKTQRPNNQTPIPQTPVWVDPHLHFFALDQGEYHWLRADSPPFWPDKGQIAQSFNSAELSSAIAAAGLAPSEYRFVHIEAGYNNAQPEAEIAWLAKHMAGTGIDYRAIGCCDLLLSPESFQLQVTLLQQYECVVGVRHILDENAVEYLQRPKVQANLAWLAKQDLIFECQCDCSDPNVVTKISLFLSAYPQARWVINHSGGAVFNDGTATTKDWARLAQLAAFPNVFIKASGWEMSDREFSLEQVKQSVLRLIDIWGDDRVMLASNAPLLHWRMGYAEYVDSMSELFSDMPAVLSDNALHVYFNQSTAP